MAFFPDDDLDLNDYFIFSVEYILDNEERFALSDSNKKKMNDTLDLWLIRFPKAIGATTSTKTTVAEKNKTRKEMKAILRIIYGDIPNSILTVKDRIVLNIPVMGGIRNVLAMTNSTPIGVLNSGNRLNHNITISDSQSGKRAQPKGVSACEIWQKISEEPPFDEEDLKYVGSTSNHSFSCNFKGSNAGKKVWYWIRWVNSQNDKGSWGPMFSGNIQG